LLLCLRLGFKEITERKKEILRQMQRTVKRKMSRDKWLNWSGKKSPKTGTNILFQVH
jgi:hypothetical protein